MAAQVEFEDQSSSVTELDNGEILNPLSDASSSSPILLLREGGQEHDVITKCFLSGFGASTLPNPTTTTKIVTIRKRSPNTITTRAKSLAFRIFTEATARKNNGDPNVKYGWYAGSSREQIERVITHGFSSREIDDSRGIGIHLVPSHFSLFAAEATEEDEEGLRHLLLCRLILGKPEEIISWSKQAYPSSVEFDSGVDDVLNPRKYIIWSSNMNSHIMPAYIVTFRSPPLTVVSRGGSPAVPSSLRVSFAALASTLSKSMDTLRMNLIMSTYDDFRKRKIQRDQLVRKMREVAGDNLLAQIIKNHRDINRVNREKGSHL